MHVPLCGAFVNMNSIEAVNESFLCVQTRNVNGMAKKKELDNPSRHSTKMSEFDIEGIMVR